jgi:hypothetical protein
MNTQFISQIMSDGTQASLVEEIKVDDNNSTTYIGYCLPTCTGIDDRKWFIRRVTKQNGNFTIIDYPDGKRDYNQQWSERAGLNYKLTPNFY